MAIENVEKKLQGKNLNENGVKFMFHFSTIKLKYLHSKTAWAICVLKIENFLANPLFHTVFILITVLTIDRYKYYHRLKSIL